ncbi:MAG: hypothetical protein ACT4OZ_00970 [Gemmatimonadota bacterium]
MQRLAPDDDCVATVVRSPNELMRKQYYFLQTARGLLAWDVDRLIQLSASLPRTQVPLSRIRELEQPWSGDDEAQTWRAMVQHISLMDQADLSYPIILSASGAVMDGMHRVAKALRAGHRDITAVQFERDPEPDHVGRGPQDLPYERP